MIRRRKGKGPIVHEVNLTPSFVDARTRYDNRILVSRFVTSLLREGNIIPPETAKLEQTHSKNDLCPSKFSTKSSCNSTKTFTSKAILPLRVLAKHFKYSIILYFVNVNLCVNKI